MTLGGVTTGTGAGSYNATFTLKDTVGTQWADGTTEPKTVTWSIGKAAGSVSLNPQSLTLDTDNPTKTITVTRAGTGAISAQSSAPGVASVQVSGTTITVTGLENGSATVTVNVAADSNYNAASPAQCAVTVSLLKDNFADNEWSEIIAACQSGNVPASWVVGNYKNMTINGKAYRIDIIGKNHDTYAAGGTAPLTFQMHDCYTETKQMNSSNTNSGGWTNCAMRSTHLPAIMNLMPAEVKAAIKEVQKKTSAGSQSSSIQTTNDKLFLLSEIEIFGSTTYSFAGEGTQYDYYKAGNSKVKNRVRQREPLVGAFSSFQLLHPLLSCLQRRQRLRRLRQLLEWRGLRLLLLIQHPPNTRALWVAGEREQGGPPPVRGGPDGRHHVGLQIQTGHQRHAVYRDGAAAGGPHPSPAASKRRSGTAFS